MSELLDYFNGEQMPGDVWRGKYAMENEDTPDDMHRRLAKMFAEAKAPSEDMQEFWETHYYNLMKEFKYIIPQGSIMAIGGSGVLGSLSNCFVIGQPYDSYGGIMQKDEEQAQLMKRRGGVGQDISTLRPRGTSTNNAAKTSTGAVSFMHRFSNTTREVAQEGRRGALMLSIDVRHPDSPDFVKVKGDKTSVTGANISVKLRDDFMKAVSKEEDYILRWPIDLENRCPEIETHPEILKYDEIEKVEESISNSNYQTIGHIKKIKAKKLFDSIVHHAWKSAEPGILFQDRHWDYSPDGVYPEHKMITTNPCGEIGMGAYDACRLLAINLLSFVDNPFTERAEFNMGKFRRAVAEMQRMADLIVDIELEYVSKIIQKIELSNDPIEVKRTELELWKKIYNVAKAGRRTGCGVTALADCLAAVGLKYDSDEAIALTGMIFKMKMEAELRTSIELAKEQAPFESWDENAEYEIVDGAIIKGKNTFFQMLLEEFPELVQEMCEHGRRNISWSTVAPTGTVSLMTQTSSGIEPLFSAFHFRKRKLSEKDETPADFVDELGDRWIEYPVLHPPFKKWINSQHGILWVENKEVEDFTGEEVQAIFEKSPWYGCQANDIDWIKRVQIQAIIQKYTTHSISATINLPKDVSQEKVAEIYMESWIQGLKGVTVYRDGSRDGVLTNKSVKDLLEDFPQHDAPKRPKSLNAHYYFVRSGSRKYAVIVGLLNNKPYEVFAFEDPVMEEELKGQIIKVRRGVYKFESPKYTIDNLQLSSEHNDEKLFTKFVSQLLRHGVRPIHVVDIIDGVELEINNFKKVVGRTLKQYIQNGEASTLVCLECNSKEVIFQEGCQTCTFCGSSKCG